ncbi:MAG TPA: ABC transporter ATP-binding protein [Thermotogota bacterium]|nr:ABC transporter ATP-binding protein [Thermotogota bacterium]NLH19385.1 ABC transporter ATP-binding protein [Thermotogaceae bacterium]OQC31950.1 MAG: Spermidine/putrescine import ATP-binding protein PotA [Thermotogota bacterium ADurb.Bin062]HNW47038.1 ABC transporter ATP-binding protein [Thermotogota bacterium]HNY81765.1 ABC transporter ATP-binding protein [Thermotogota bacterium]
MPASSVSLTNVYKAFKGFKGEEILAVDDVSFRIEPGAFVTLLGPSGCGKTTSLRMIAGFENPTKGKIKIDEEDVTFIPPWKRDTAMVFQSYGLFPHMNVGDNVGYGLKMRKVTTSERHKKVSAILDLVGLSGFEERPPSSLSGGQQQRVALARALVVEPSVLLFDEPLSNLDVLLREQMRVEIRRIQQKTGITAIYVTHDRTEAMTLSDTVIVMNKGKIVQTGTPFDIYEEPNSIFVADFMGKMAYFPVKILAWEGKDAIVELYDKKLSVRVAKNVTPNDSQRYILACRPESMKMQENGKGVVPGVITTNVYLGNAIESYIKTEFGEVMVKSELPKEGLRPEGSPVSLSIREDKAVLLPLDPGIDGLSLNKANI